MYPRRGADPRPVQPGCFAGIRMPADSAAVLVQVWSERGGNSYRLSENQATASEKRRRPNRTIPGTHCRVQVSRRIGQNLPSFSFLCERRCATGARSRPGCAAPFGSADSGNGAGDRNRTRDRLITNQLLDLLSYASCCGVGETPGARSLAGIGDSTQTPLRTRSGFRDTPAAPG